VLASCWQVLLHMLMDICQRRCFYEVSGGSVDIINGCLSNGTRIIRTMLKPKAGCLSALFDAQAPKTIKLQPQVNGIYLICSDNIFTDIILSSPSAHSIDHNSPVFSVSTSHGSGHCKVLSMLSSFCPVSKLACRPNRGL
jgi:hypothetical protein